MTFLCRELLKGDRDDNLRAQQLDLNTCWAALTFNKKKVKEIIPQGETLCMVIAAYHFEAATNKKVSH